MARLDPHSFTDFDQPLALSISLALAVNFDSKILEGHVELDFETVVSGPVDLDTRDLTIHSAVNQGGTPVPFEWGEEHPVLGRRLRLSLPAGTRRITVAYRTSPEASALQWLSPEQTLGKSRPFLFSQCQAIHARSLVPLQDTPKARVPYRAELTVPEGLTAVMSAGCEGEREGPTPGTRTFSFHMPQPIPPYLLALAVGRIEGRDLSPRSRIYAEPETLDAAAWEFAEVEELIQKAEGIFGPYDWDRYDMLVLPPSFPYGGMENPRITFLTPTVLAGDRSLVDVVAHELAHSWTGNLVTNVSADHFWLNEGFTVWAERRILEAVHGKEYAVRQYAIGDGRLRVDLARLGADSSYTRLRQELKPEDVPEDAVSYIHYEKSSRLVVLLERTAGRERFDAFIKEYMSRFRFTSITTEEFTAFLKEKMPDVHDEVDLHAWLYEPGLPEDCPVFRSEGLDALKGWAGGWTEGRRPPEEVTAGWSPHDVLIYLCDLPRELDTDGCRWLDQRLHLTEQGNFEILCEWLALAAGSAYEPAFERIREVLTTVGRIKYLDPIYKALGKNQETRAMARAAFGEARDFYHATARRFVEMAMEKFENP